MEERKARLETMIITMTQGLGRSATLLFALGLLFQCSNAMQENEDTPKPGNTWDNYNEWDYELRPWLGHIRHGEKSMSLAKFADKRRWNLTEQRLEMLRLLDGLALYAVYSSVSGYYDFKYDRTPEDEILNGTIAVLIENNFWEQMSSEQTVRGFLRCRYLYHKESKTPYPEKLNNLHRPRYCPPGKIFYASVPSYKQRAISVLTEVAVLETKVHDSVWNAAQPILAGAWNAITGLSKLIFCEECGKAFDHLERLLNESRSSGRWEELMKEVEGCPRCERWLRERNESLVI